MKNDLMMMNTNPYTMGMLSPTMFGTVPYGGYTMTGSIHGPAGTPEDIAEKKFLETPDDAVTDVDLKKAEASLPQKSAQEETKGHERHLKDQNNKPILFVVPKNELKNPNKPKNLIVKNIEVPEQVAQRLLKSNVQSAKRSKNQIVQQRNLKTKKPVLKAKSTKKVAVNGAHKNPVRAALNKNRQNIALSAHSKIARQKFSSKKPVLVKKMPAAKANRSMKTKVMLSPKTKKYTTYEKLPQITYFRKPDGKLYKRTRFLWRKKTVAAPSVVKRKVNYAFKKEKVSPSKHKLIKVKHVKATVGSKLHRTVVHKKPDGFFKRIIKHIIPVRKALNIRRPVPAARAQPAKIAQKTTLAKKPKVDPPRKLTAKSFSQTSGQQEINEKNSAVAKQKNVLVIPKVNRLLNTADVKEILNNVPSTQTPLPAAKEETSTPVNRQLSAPTTSALQPKTNDEAPKTKEVGDALKTDSGLPKISA